ncbi:MAG TPA: hypothetical protein VLC98_11245 [Phnomibacter sp.]|nr:hypothetical protein [Phnomibacter sp.]
MQRLAFLLLVFVATACHKEFGATAANKDELMVMNAIKKTVPAAEIKKLEWEQMEPIEHYNQLIGYKVPFDNNTDSSYSFILANISDNQVGTLYKNLVKYKVVSGERYPSIIRNYNYSTGESLEFDTQNGVEKTALQKGVLLPVSLKSEDLKFPAVTICAEGNVEPGQKRFKFFDTYILSYLVGGPELAANGSKATDKPTLPYYDPRPAKYSLQKNKTSIIAWEIAE